MKEYTSNKKGIGSKIQSVFLWILKILMFLLFCLTMYNLFVSRGEAV